MSGTESGLGFLNKLFEAGIIPEKTRRVVIDARLDNVVTIYIEQLGDVRLSEPGILAELRSVEKVLPSGESSEPMLSPDKWFELYQKIPVVIENYVPPDGEEQGWTAEQIRELLLDRLDWVPTVTQVRAAMRCCL